MGMELADPSLALFLEESSTKFDHCPFCLATAPGPDAGSVQVGLGKTSVATDS
jgi:hypothetical protein